MTYTEDGERLPTAEALLHLGTRLRDWSSSVFVLFAVAAVALYGDTALPTNLQARAQRLYQQFVPPCCWRGSLANHESPAANHLRQEIDQALAHGVSDTEIKTQVIHEYGKAILRVPEGTVGAIVFLVPAGLVLISMLVLSIVLVCWAKRSKVASTEDPDDRLQHWRELAENDTRWAEV